MASKGAAASRPARTLRLISAQVSAVMVPEGLVMAAEGREEFDVAEGIGLVDHAADVVLHAAVTAEEVLTFAP